MSNAFLAVACVAPTWLLAWVVFGLAYCAASDAAIAHLVVDGKSAVEKLREQVQNLE